MSKTFIDTNILVYAVDKHDKKKQKLCRSILLGLKEQPRGVVSTQVLQEFYVTVTKKLGVDALLAKSILRTIHNFELITVTPDLINEAIDTSIINQLSFWDALIIVAAESAKCETLLTEDMNHGQVVRGVALTNPFLPNE